MLQDNGTLEVGDEHYVAVTNGIRVYVKPHYLEEQSDPAKGRHFWAYTIAIHNKGNSIVQLKQRFWEITNAEGAVERVQGPGVVGEQPVLKPGEAFQYTSGCPLNTDSGFMVGHYTMQTETGDMFNVDIPAFSLDRPAFGRRLN